MSEQPIEVSLVKIEPLNKTLLHCVTSNSNTYIDWDNQCTVALLPSILEFRSHRLHNQVWMLHQHNITKLMHDGLCSKKEVLFKVL